MSRETSEWLNQNTLIGFTAKRGTAWHYSEDSQGEEPNHYEGAIPVEDVRRRLFDWHPVRVGLEWASDGSDDDLPFTRDAITGTYGIVASDNGDFLGMRGDSMPPSYGEALIDRVSLILGDSLSIGSAGLLDSRRKAWVQVEQPESLSHAGVEYRPHLLACSSMDSSIQNTFKHAVTVVVCDNTLSAAMGERGNTFKVKATKFAKLNVLSAREALDIVFETGDSFARELERLTNTSVTEDQWSKFLDAYSPTKGKEGRGLTIAQNEKGTLMKLWQTDERVTPWRGTAFGVIQAVNTFVHHFATVRNMSREERNMERKLKGEWDTIDRDTEAMLQGIH